MDDVNNKGVPDKARINVNEEWQVNSWCRRLKCTAKELREAVQKIGTSADEVITYLARKNYIR